MLAEPAGWRVEAGPAVLEGGAVRLPGGEPRERRLALDVEVPRGSEVSVVLLRFETRPEPGERDPGIPRPADTEALLRCDGVILQGLDRNHTDVRLPPGRHTLTLDVWMGREDRERTLRVRVIEKPAGLEEFLAEARTLLDLALVVMDEAATREVLATVESAIANAPADLAGAAADLARERARLAATHPPADVRVHLIGNSHLDVAWLWTTEETRGKMARTTATVLRLMEELPDFRFLQTQPQLYAWLEEDHPELFEQVRRRVAEGRWEALGAMWVEPDCNIPGGEALVRQILYGQRYWRERFGRDTDVLWLPDTFGYAWALPQLVAKSGLRHFVTMKLTWNDTNRFPHGHFDWEGVDGTRVRCTLPQTLDRRPTPKEIARAWEAYPSKEVAPALLFPYGYGDGGGGPVREDVLVARALGEAPAFPRCGLTSMSDALERIRAEADTRARERGVPVPVWRGELYLEMHRGTLTTHARMKAENRRAELALRDGEIWSSLAAIHAHSTYPAAALDEAWRKVLLNQFHDIVPGSSIPEVYPDAHRRYAEATDTAMGAADRARRALLQPSGPSRGARAAATASPFAFTLVSSVPWATREWVELSVPAELPFHLVDRSGDVVPHQVVSTDDAGVRIGLEATLPPMGAASLRVVAGEAETPEALTADVRRLEGGRLRVALDERGRMRSLFAGGREWLAAPANELQTFVDEPAHWEAWEVDPADERTRRDVFTLEDVEVASAGPLRAALRLRHVSSGGSVLEQEVSVYRRIPRVDIASRVDWRERRTLLKAAFPLAVHATEATYEIQFGAIARPTHRNTSWDAARYEVCGHRWADLSEGNGGVSLLNDGRYGHDALGGTLRLSLLRNAIAPDPREPMRAGPAADREPRFTDTGEHRFRYALYPHPGDWRRGTVRQAWSFNVPPTVLAGVEGELEGWGGGRGVVIETLKRAEDGKGWILRVWEAHGARRRARMRLPFDAADAEAVDLMERPSDEEAPALEGRTLRFSLGAYEVRSFRITSA